MSTLPNTTTPLAGRYRENRNVDFYISFGIAIVALLIGSIGVMQVIFGHNHGAITSYVPWGLWVAVYVYLVWLEVGMVLSYFVLKYVFHVKGVEKLGPVVMLAAFAALIGALTVIGMDLGQPFRAWRNFLTPNFGSLMTWMIWMHTFYLVLLGVEIYAYRMKNERVLKVATVISVPAGVALIAIIGGLFGVLAARPFWNATVLPLLFLISSIVAGMGMLVLLHLLFSPLAGTQQYRETAMRMGRIFMWAILLGLVAAMANALVLAYPQVPAQTEGLKLALFGPYWWSIWVVHLGFGIVVPLVLLWRKPRSLLAIGTAAALMAGTFVMVPLNIVIPGLAHPPADLKGLAEAYIHPLLSFDYFPSLVEWLVVAFAIGVTLAIFSLGYRLIFEKQLREMAREANGN
jgi:protein NrfD